MTTPTDPDNARDEALADAHGYHDDAHAHPTCPICWPLTTEPRCDMRHDCTAPVTMISDGGWIYCTHHGEQRRQWERTRKLRPHEMNRIRRGQTIERY